MNIEIFKEIIEQFAERLAGQRFLGHEYALYIFSIVSPGKSNNYLLRLEAFDSTLNFDKEKGFPIPQENGLLLNVSLKNYQNYAYGPGGQICLFNSIHNDHLANNGETLIGPDLLSYWMNKYVYYCGYEFEDTRLVIFLTFDFSPDDPSNALAEKELYDINIDAVLRNVEDTHQKKYIFNQRYLGVLKQTINKDDFKLIHEFVENLSLNYRYTNYLQKIYYDFLRINLWMYSDQLDPLQQEKLISLIKEFEKNQKNLFIIPYYRDHFLHQFNVYILGISIISTVSNELKNNIVEVFNRSYYPIKGQTYRDLNDISFIWFLTAMFHDIAYPVEKCGDWLDAFFQQYTHRQKSKRAILEANIDISNMISDVAYNSCIEDLAEYHRKLHFERSKINYELMTLKPTINRGCEIRSRIFDQSMRFRDHGILSAIMLLLRLKKEKELYRFLFPAAAAISIHNHLWTTPDILENRCARCTDTQCEKCTKWKVSYDEFFEKWKNGTENRQPRDKVENLRYISYERDPVGFLLILCDLLHDWGRHDVDKAGQVFDLFFNPCQLVNINVNKNEIVLFIEIEEPSDPDTAEKIKNFLRYKKQEIVKIFSRLQFIDSHDIVIQLFSKTMHPINFSMNYFSGHP